MAEQQNDGKTLYVKGPRRRYTPACADTIHAAARLLADARAQRGESFLEPVFSQAYFRDKLGGAEREIFAAAFLDTRHKLINYAEIFMGSIDGAEVHPREIVKAALRHNAAAVIVAHNHPSGDVTPSAADRVVTARVKQALALVDVRMIDHVIVGGNQTLSMAAAGQV